MIRRDPRADRAAMTVARHPRLRLDRTHRGGASAPTGPIPQAESGPLHIADPAFLVFAIIECPGSVISRHHRQLLGAARLLAGENGAVVLLAAAPIEGAGTAGADRTIILPIDTYDPAGHATLILQAITEHGPRHVLFAETTDGGDLARRVAALCDADLFANAESLSPRLTTRPTDAGRREERAVPPRLISIAADRIAPYRGPAHEATALPPPHPAPSPLGALHAVPIAIDPATIPLDQAPLVIAAGNGVTDFPAFLDLARALGATPGASRVVCDAGDLPRAMQVGASGTVLNAECYIALGISGAPQHLQGIGTVEHIVAINTDLHAAIIARAGLAIIADAKDVMAALRRRL